MLTDLALILILAGVVTVLFKRLHQPLVLGYIVAGFLASPHMPYTPSVSDTESLEMWSEIGVIFLMFTLGLEFSFKRIVKMGIGPVVAALCIMLSMMGVGSGAGWLFGWGGMDRLFLGGMLAMSSTTIIYKAFDELGLRSRKFASSVLSVLVLEDILGILLMVVLSAMAATRQFDGTELVMSLVKLGFCLLLWFLVGVYVVPLFLRKNSRFINSETLLIVSVGLCFALVVLSTRMGYSPAFGAFMMGSILAETVEAERIERAVGGIRDLFGAIFFVSVGMLVRPEALTEYWLPILFITLAIIIGQAVFGTVGYLLSGLSLQSAMRGGFSMAQIGEFAFILAALGESLGVTSGHLYPIVVAVSIVTTFLTPYMMRLSVPAYAVVQRLVPGRVVSVLDRSRGDSKRVRRYEERVYTVRSSWSTLLSALLSQTAAYLTLSVALVSLSLASVLPLCRQIFTHWPGNIVCGIVTLLVVSLFLRPIVMRKNHSLEVRFLRRQGRLHGLLFDVLTVVRYALACVVVYHVLDYLSPYRWYYHIAASMGIVLLMVRSRAVKYLSVRMERTFVQNLRRREHLYDAQHPTYARRLQGRDLHMTTLTIPAQSQWAGRTLAALRLGSRNAVHVVAVLRGNQRINIPGGNTTLYPMDQLEVVGDDASIASLAQRMEAEVSTAPCDERPLVLQRITLSEHSPLVGRMLRDSGVRDRYHCMVVGMENDEGMLSSPAADHVFRRQDTLWVVGAAESIRQMMQAK